MHRERRLYLSLFVGLILFTLAYCGFRELRVPMPHYYPTLKKWSAATIPNLPSMGWYALTGVSLLTAGIGGVLAYTLSGQSPVSLRTVKTVGWIAVAASVLLMVYIFQREWRHWIA